MLSGGLGGAYNAAITKLMLANHGYSEKVQQDNTSSDGSMTPERTIDPTKLSDSALEELNGAFSEDK